MAMYDHPQESRFHRGYAIPQYPGSFFGQSLGYEKLVPTGKTLSKKGGDGKWFSFPIRERRMFTAWVWDGTKWMTDVEFDAEYSRENLLDRRTVNDASVKFPSKRDFNRFGERRQIK